MATVQITYGEAKADGTQPTRAFFQLNDVSGKRHQARARGPCLRESALMLHLGPWGGPHWAAGRVCTFYRAPGLSERGALRPTQGRLRALGRAGTARRGR